MKRRSLELYYISMLTPGIIMLLIFSVIPMFGIVIAFQKFSPVKGIFGSPFVGLKNYQIAFMLPTTKQVILNTLIIAVSKIALNIFVPVVFALLLNECRNRGFKRAVQTIVYLPHFLSWVIVGAMFINVFSISGIVNQLLARFGLEQPIVFMSSNTWFRPIVIGTDVWKGFGFSAVVYIAAITAIDPSLYESAQIDGANRWQMALKITLPSIMATVVLMATLALGNILSAGFDQIFNMYNPVVYETVDILDTYVYRIAFPERSGVQRFDISTAIGLLKSVISFVLIILSFSLAYKYADYTIF